MKLLSSSLGAVVLAAAQYLAAVADAKFTPPPEYALTPSANGRFFQDADGKPFFWQADTAWLLTHRLSFEEADRYLADRKAKGYNVVLNVGFTQIGIDSPNRNGDVTFIGSDPTKPNEPYWAFVDSVIELAWTKYGIRMALIPAWGQYVHDNTEPGVLTAANGGPFGQFIGKRYPYLPKFLFADINPYWGDQSALEKAYFLGGVTPSFPSSDFTAAYDALAKGIVAGEREAVGASWNPLMTIHPRNQWMPDAPPALASSNMGDSEWMNFDCVQSGHIYAPPHPPSGWWNAKRAWDPVEMMWNASTTGRKRPVLDNEPHYEARWTSKAGVEAWNASDVRIGSWQSVFAGAAGVTYGNDNVMQVWIPDKFDPANSGIKQDFFEALQTPGAGMMQYIRQAISDRGNSTFNDRIPAQNIIIGDKGELDKRIFATRDAKGHWLMVYTPTGAAFTIDTTSLASGKGCRVVASWLNPLDGTYTAFDLATATGPADKLKFTPPKSSDHADWVLVMEHKGKKA